MLGRRRGSEGEWVEYASGEAAARALGVNGGSVRSCCSGERKRAGEYEFKWAPLAADQHDRPGEEWREVQKTLRAAHHWSECRVRAKKGGCECPNSVMLLEACYGSGTVR